MKDLALILLPSFLRTVRRDACRQMLDLNHYAVKMCLKWYGKKYGVVDCNEALHIKKPLMGWID